MGTGWQCHVCGVSEPAIREVGTHASRGAAGGLVGFVLRFAVGGRAKARGTGVRVGFGRRVYRKDRDRCGACGRADEEGWLGLYFVDFGAEKVWSPVSRFESGDVDTYFVPDPFGVLGNGIVTDGSAYVHQNRWLGRVTRGPDDGPAASSGRNAQHADTQGVCEGRELCTKN